MVDIKYKCAPFKMYNNNPRPDVMYFRVIYYFWSLILFISESEVYYVEILSKSVWARQILAKIDLQEPVIWWYSYKLVTSNPPKLNFGQKIYNSWVWT